MTAGNRGRSIIQTQPFTPLLQSSAPAYSYMPTYITTQEEATAFQPLIYKDCEVPWLKLIF
jgi:hypothetical protein